jgi:predicted MPP superfamily phosphohydrolase
VSLSITRLVIFLTVILTIVAGVHFYLWIRLVRDTALPSPYRPWVTGALLGLAVLLPLPLLIARRVSVASSRWLAWPAYLWMGFMFLLFVLLLTSDVLRFAAWLPSKINLGAPLGDLQDASRRTFVARLLGGAAAAAAGVVGLFAVRQALRQVVVKEVEVRLPRLPAAGHGTTIVQLTDIHVGPTIGRAFIEDLVRRTNALAPDVIAITGDLVDGSVEQLWDAVEPLGQLRARHGVYFVTGNHEYFSGVEPWLAALGRLGIRVLANERVSIGGEAGFDLAGIHDHSAGRIEPSHKADLPRALAGRDPGRALVLLAHQPKGVEQAAKLGVGLQLSGHTHGGQIWPFTYLVKLAFPFVHGLHQVGTTQLYVSPGTGYWGPPMRLGTRGEISRIKLLADA